MYPSIALRNDGERRQSNTAFAWCAQQMVQYVLSVSYSEAGCVHRSRQRSLDP